jgi:chitosanase
MTFTATDKLKAMAIVSVFETGKPFGKFSTVAVLDDGAGISYGFSQFTHRSGALAAVLDKYLLLGGTLGTEVIKSRMPIVRRVTKSAIDNLAEDRAFKNALRAAGITGEMRQAQIEIAMERYLQPAINECERLGFTSPLSLAVIYDSITHGSYERFRDATSKSSPPYEGGVDAGTADGVVLSFEQKWITEYVHRRDQWLASVPRLTKTRYRTQFFLKEISRKNWELVLPIKPNGVTINEAAIEVVQKYFSEHEVRQPLSTAVQVTPIAPQTAPSIPTVTSQTTPQPPARPSKTAEAETRRKGEEERRAETRPLGSVQIDGSNSYLDEIEDSVNTAAATYDQVERIATTVTTRNDAAKSLWTTVVGSVTQTFWALISLIAGIPREVWLVVAVIAALLMLMYLYRQIALGKIRERLVIGDR